MLRLIFSYGKYICTRTAVAALAIAGVTLLIAPARTNAVGLTYVDGNALLAPNLANLTDINIVSFATNDNQWGLRTPFAADGSVFESGIGENSPEINQTISGLTPGNHYDMYVVYWTGATSATDWRIQAGLASGSLTLFNNNGSTAALPTAQAGRYGGAGVWDLPPMSGANPIFAESGRVLRLGFLGAAAADAAGQVKVYIDDTASAGSNGRTWFDGVAYVAAGTPVFLSSTIDRATGALTITNSTTENFTIKSYSITSAVGGLDATEWTTVTGTIDGNGTGTFDANPWAVSAPANPAATPFATALTEAATVGNGGTLLAGQPLQLGDVWAPTPYQDVVITLTLSNNSTLTMSPDYIGSAIALGDFNGLNGINEADYQVLMTNLHTNVAGLTIAEAYTRGDMNSDRLIDYDDFNDFAIAFDAVNSPGAFAAMAGTVPEPGALFLSVSGIIVAVITTRRSRYRRVANVYSVPHAAIATALTMATLLSGVAQAAPVTGWQLDTSFGGGTGLTVLSNSETDSPTLGDGTVNNAGNAGMYAAFPTVNIAQGQQIVLTGTATLVGAAAAPSFRYGVLMENGDPPDTLAWFGYWTTSSSGGRNGSIVSRDPDGSTFNTNTSFSTGGGTAKTLAIGGRTQDLFADGTYNFSMTIGRFNDDTTTAYATITSGSGYSMRIFRGTETDPANITFNFNRVGLLAGAGFAADQMQFGGVDLSVQTIVAPTMKVTPAGEVTIVNTTGSSLDLKYYEITSSSGALNLGGWSTLDSTEADDPVGTGWDVAGGSSAFLLSEGNLQGATTLTTGQSLSLGSAAQAGANDLRFYYALPDGSIYRGLVEYVTAVPGDFDSDGDVDGTDFVAWQNHFPMSSGAMLSDGDGDGDGDVDGVDFVIWQTNFPFSPSSGVAPVPEPGAGSLLAIAGLVSLSLRRRARTNRVFSL